MERCGSEANADSGILDMRSRKFGIGRGVEVLRMVEKLVAIAESEMLVVGMERPATATSI